MTPSRRGLFLGAAGSSLAATSPIARLSLDDAWHQTTMERYFGFGDKASGGLGDSASGDWLEAELSRAGYRCSRQYFEAPWFETEQATLSIDGLSAPVIPQAVVTPTNAGGLNAPLRLALGDGRLDGAIAIIVLPSRRWSSALDAQILSALAGSWARGAAACILVTTGPTGDALALNAPAHRAPGGGPIAILAPTQAPAFLNAASEGRTGRLTITGTGGSRPAYNLIARLSRNARQTVVLSTPRSGWFGCAGERGSGIAVWLAAALWLADRRDDIDIELVAISGHEYENLGGERYLHEQAPPPNRTGLWIHVGANLAARDWHETHPMRPLPGPDSQRYLLASPDIREAFGRAFAGQPGLEVVYPATVENSAGELTNILRTGYPTAAGFFGAHRFHHSRNDDMRCVSGDLVRPVSEALCAALAEILRSRSQT